MFVRAKLISPPFSLPKPFIIMFSRISLKRSSTVLTKREQNKPKDGKKNPKNNNNNQPNRLQLAIHCQFQHQPTPLSLTPQQIASSLGKSVAPVSSVSRSDAPLIGLVHFVFVRINCRDTRGRCGTPKKNYVRLLDMRLAGNRSCLQNWATQKIVSQRDGRRE